MEEGQITLNDLLVDEDELNEELLANLLSDYVRIGSSSGSLVTQPAFRELDSRRKAAVVLLAQKARHALELAESEWMTPTEISKASGIKKGTVYPAVRDLEQDVGIAEGDDGNYRIPTYNLNRVQDYIRGEEE